jgi:hypothetical protein
MMGRGNRILDLLYFLARFLVLAPIIVAIWWSLIPYYGYLIVQVAGSVDRFVFGMPITAVAVRPEGILNTGTNIVFQITPPGGEMFERSCPLALLVTNLVPYVALVLATLGLALRQRLKVLLAGGGIIIAGHLLYVILFVRFKEVLMQNSELVTSTLQFFIVLPFLLWIWFVYSERIAAYLAESDADEAAAIAVKRDKDAAP